MDFLDPVAYADGRAEDWLTYLRHNHPVWQQPDPAGHPGVWFITRHADVNAVSRDPETFSSDRVNGGIDGLTEAEKEKTVQALAGQHPMFIMLDPPEHGIRRRNLQPGLSAKAVTQYADRIRVITNRTLDRVLEQQEFDFISDVAVEIPLNLVADLIGVPDEDRRELFQDVENTERPADPRAYADPARVAKMIESINAVKEYGRRLILQRMEEPTDDLATQLAHSTAHGQPLPIEENMANFYMLWGAGAETTRTALAWGLWAFIQSPDQYRKIRENPDLLDGPAVEEILRWATPVHQFRRNVMKDTEIQGIPIKAGEAVTIWYTSANRDEDVFDDPFRFDVTRERNQHLSFGGGGPHFCLGAHLARLELNIVFREIARRVPDPQLLAEPQRLLSHRFRGITSMPVRFG
jgi:cholest-4-en-3-one 26-monooxygenase